MDKRGLSEVVIILFILLSIIAVILLWAVIKNILDDRGEELIFNNIALEIKNYHVYISPSLDGSGSVSLTLLRTSGSGNISSLLFSFISSNKSYIYKIDSNVNLQEFEEKTFNFPLAKIYINSIADFNHDNVLNFTDFQSIGNGWNTERGDPNFNPLADLNNDGKINVFDLVSFRQLFFDQKPFDKIKVASYSRLKSGKEIQSGTGFLNIH